MLAQVLPNIVIIYSGGIAVPPIKGKEEDKTVDLDLIWAIFLAMLILIFRDANAEKLGSVPESNRYTLSLVF